MPAVEPQLRHVLRVLIVEDETRLRDLLADVIPDMGFIAGTARTAEDALRILTEQTHEIVLLDLRLPSMGGMECFEQIRSRWPQTQVIIMTGHGDLDAARAAIRLDVVDFLAKPSPLKNIEESLDRARRRIAAQPASLPVPLDTGETSPSMEDSQPTTLEESERRQILAALARNDGNRTATAVELGVSRRMLHYRLAEYQKQGHLPPSAP